MDFSAFYDISDLESFHDKPRLSRLDLSSTISFRKIHRSIASFKLVLISNLRPPPLFLRPLSIVPRNDVSFTTSKNDSNPRVSNGTRAIVLSSSTVATCFRFDRFLLEKEKRTLGNAVFSTRIPLTDPNDNRTIRDTESKKGRTISRGGRRIENGSTARGREYRRGQFDDPSGDLRARHPFIHSARRKSPF